MEFFIKISQFLLSLSLLIVLHELGHFIPAKLFKTRVEKFYLFFDLKYSLFKKKIGETVYGIGWLPLGGYVKISGMIDESMDTEQMAQAPQPWEFRSKPSWQRLIIMLGGVTVNFILAAVIYIFMAFFYGSSDVDANSVKGGYAIYNPVLQEIGLKDGDKVLAINDYKIEYFSDIRKYILEAETMTIEREGQQQTINFPVDFLGQLSASKKRGLIELRQPFIFDSFAENSINEGVDLRKGDIFKTINGQSAEFFDEVVSILQTLKNQTATATLERDGALISRELQINSEGAFALFVSQSMNDYQDAGYFDIIKKQYDFGESIGVGLDRFISQISSYWMQLKLIFSPSTGAYKGVGGFKA
ncbi:MAG: site-2 protease family protein, partial [Flavobacteriaceae bacterium]